MVQPGSVVAILGAGVMGEIVLAGLLRAFAVLAVVDDDVRAFLGQAQRNALPYAAIAARDERHFAL